MGEKLVIGPINKGLKTDRTPFNIDNDSFPTLVNAYQWRGRIKRKRGTSLLTRLRRFLGTTDGSGNFSVNIAPGSIGTGYTSYIIGTDVFTDPGTASSPVTLITNGSGSGTLNRSTGALAITGSQAITSVYYYPGLPVMGLEDFATTSSDFFITIAFDTKYAYSIPVTTPFQAYSVSYYKNPASVLINSIQYTQKTASTPVVWNGLDYQQFWTTNYQSAMWATNGVTVPFLTNNIGMQFKSIATITYVSGTQVTITITESSTVLVIGDWVFLNEITSSGGTADSTTINFQTGFITAVANNGTTTTITVRLPYAAVAAAGGGGSYSGGIVQYLTNSSDSTKDCIRWYDGDPTVAGVPQTTTPTGLGWVNFAPPISQSLISIADLPRAQYYLVGARVIFPFKDRLVFFGVVVQASSGNPIYLQDTIVYSQNGTPYYTASFTGSVTSSATVFNPLLTPKYNPNVLTTSQTATPNAYFSDVTGFGGFQTVGVDQPITTVSSNEDVLIVGFQYLQARMTYTGNDIVPFNFFVINSELGSSSTFSAINMDKGVMTRGSRGFIITSQTGAQRIDLDIPDTVFEIKLPNNGRERVCAQRDFINEWAYFTYPNNQNRYVYPNQTLLFNYRDDSWAVFYESYTTYGTFRKQDGLTWANIGNTVGTWGGWNASWNSGDSAALLQSQIIAGNAQGFVLIRVAETSEGNSGFISNINSSTGVVTAPNHMLNDEDYIIISGATGTVSAYVNNLVFSVTVIDANSFRLNPTVTTGTYTGSAVFKKMYIPYIQTKQFPVAWEMARKTRLGPQQYLFKRTDIGQITLLIFLSEDPNNAYNTMTSFNPVIPETQGIDVSGVNNAGTIYSTVLYTCPESSNLGLTEANQNLNTPTANSQSQIWHRMNTSLIGDTVQIGFVYSDAQMRLMSTSGSLSAITGITTASPTVITSVNTLSIGTRVKLTGIVGMPTLNYTTTNNNIYLVTAVTGTTITILVDSTTYGTYTSGGVVTPVAPINQFLEVEFHSAILDVNPSQFLC